MEANYYYYTNATPNMKSKGVPFLFPIVKIGQQTFTRTSSDGIEEK